MKENKKSEHSKNESTVIKGIVFYLVMSSQILTIIMIIIRGILEAQK
jgi:hypothetical protein